MAVDLTGDKWRVYAICNTGDGHYAGMFFPDSQGDTRAAEDEAAAIAMCAMCPVRPQCLDAAVARREQYGVWGGVNFEKQRNRAAARRSSAA